MLSALPVNRNSSTRHVALHITVLATLLVLSVVLTYPLVRILGSGILGAPAPGDNFEYLYKVWWFKRALFDLQVSPFFNARMFHPFGYNVALSETTLSNTIAALPVTLFCGEVVAYNLTMLGSFVLSGLGMYLLVLHLTASRAAGLLSGIVFAFCPYRLAHLGAGHLPLMGTQWLPLLFLYLDWMVVNQRPGDALMAALFYSLGALSAWYYAYMFALAGVVYVLLRARPWKHHLWQARFGACVATFVLTCLLLVGPFAVPVSQVWKAGERPQSLQYLDHFSASPLDFVYPNVMHPVWGQWLITRYPQNISESTLFVGVLPLLLALFALRRKRRPGTALAFCGLAAASVLLAMGTTLHWGNSTVYMPVPTQVERIFTAGMTVLTKRLAIYPISSYGLRAPGAVYLPLPTLLLYLYLPFFSAMRVWGRFGLLTLFGIAVLAGYGLKHLLNKPKPMDCPLLQKLFGRLAASPPRRIVGLLVAVALVMIEFAAFPYALGFCLVQARPVDNWLADQPGDFAIMEFPLSKAMSGRTLYAMRVHGKGISFGYGTFFPRAFNEKREVLEGFPSTDSVALLRDWGVRYVLLGSRSYGQAWPELEQQLSASPRLRHAVTLDDPAIYEGDRLLHLLPGTEQAFVVDRIHVYEVL